MEFFAKEIQTAQALFVAGWPCRAVVRETKGRVGTGRHRILHSSPVDEEKKHSYDPPYRPFGVALLAKNKESVDKFYEMALQSGGKDNGPPGYRHDYGSGYYAAFVFDPDGNNIEAVFFEE